VDMRVASGMVRYGLPGLVLGVALCLGTGMRGPEAAAQSDRGGGSGSAAQPTNAARASDGSRGGQPGRQNTIGETNGTLALITGSAGSSGQSQWLYLIDTKSRSFALYRIDPANPKGVVKLEASRQYEWDLKLEHYNNQPPEPDAIKATVQTLSRSTPQ
jgi:hypothetical protein